MSTRIGERGLIARASAPALAGAVALTGVFAAGSALLYSTSPYQHQLGLPCPFLATTGWYCPGCGTTRAFYSVMHGDFGSAIRMNVLFMVVVLPLVMWGSVAFVRSLKGLSVPVPKNPGWWTGVLIAVFAVFTVVRNLPGMEFLRP